jgi:DNA polymerase I-like protein with 3'-5' exonuclease and polymerase domains
MIFIDSQVRLEALIAIVDSYKKEEIFYCDIESTGLDWFVNQILLFQIKIEDEIYIVDVRGLGYENFRNLIRSVRKNRCVFHNAKFDLKFILHRTGILLENVYDTMTSEAILNSGKGKQFYGLGELSEKYADIFMDKETRKEFIDFPQDKPFTESQINYAALDVKVLEPIFKAQMEEFQSTKQYRVEIVESALVPIVAKMEYDGINIDAKMWLDVEKEAIIQRDSLVEAFDNSIVDFILGLKAQNGLELAQKVCIPVKTKKLARFLEEITDFENLRGWLRENFNVKSPKQLLKILILMKIRVKNTNAKVLQEFLDKEKARHPDKEYPVLENLLKIRKVNKQIDQYGSNFLKHIHSVTGKIHTEYFTVGTQTGRFSSNNPNLQNVPRKGGYRECFLPEPGYVFAAVDYSQQEYRLAGAVSREPLIINAYQSGSDMHTTTGRIVAKKNEITDEERTRGKTVNFAILYGSTEWGLQRNLRIETHEAKEIINSFWDGYPNLKKFMDLVGERILSLGYSVTPLGRRRYNEEKPLYANSNQFVKWQEQVLREGRNHIIQGGGADIIKIAMVEIYQKNPFGDKLKLALQIHDEVITQVHESIKQEALEFIIKTMEEVEQRFLGVIPAKADGKLKERWSK